MCIFMFGVNNTFTFEVKGGQLIVFSLDGDIYLVLSLTHTRTHTQCKGWQLPYKSDKCRNFIIIDVQRGKINSSIVILDLKLLVHISHCTYLFVST